MKKKRFLLLISFNFLMIILMQSCSSGKKLAYFNDIVRDSIAPIEQPAIVNGINKNDILQITVSSLDEKANQLFNTMGVGSKEAGVGGDNTGVQTGYLVDEFGFIKFPLLGSIKAAGLTKDELTKIITEQLISAKLLLNPIVSIRIVNYRITVLGEVNKPGVIPIPNERVTLPEALGFAGDLTVYGKRESILLIREKDGKRIFKRFSLNSSDLFRKDYYYLQNKDIVYVEPNNAKATLSDRNVQFIPIILSGLSFLVIILADVLKK